jgi:sterol desaturase/sphingolipid hydroxylase (fatty acid hydroxylase superfamily)
MSWYNSKMDSSDTDKKDPMPQVKTVGVDPVVQRKDTWKQNKTNQALLLIVMVTVAAWIVAILAVMFVHFTDDNWAAGLAVLPLLLVLWFSTPVALICLVALAIRTKNAVFILISSVLLLGLGGFLAYDMGLLEPYKELFS